jgi:hypothetical protein
MGRMEPSLSRGVPMTTRALGDTGSWWLCFSSPYIKENTNSVPVSRRGGGGSANGVNTPGEITVIPDENEYGPT